MVQKYIENQEGKCRYCNSQVAKKTFALSLISFIIVQIMYIEA